ncbi:L-Ala-D/L-Glu epimerase [mine drainage metagenome]|uniref:L-Ala-D/L-Glu epimerase n=1 Tax=mine drainage metagenome TaxID=410659 RepID=A0A1J5PEA2_9ZZZZ
MAGLPAPVPALTAFTLSLDAPDQMRAEAAKNAHRPLLKIKLGTPDDMHRLAAVRAGAPKARIIIDANEGWTPEIYTDLAPHLERMGVALVEQPLPAGADEMLAEIARPIPVCADESCHDRASLAAMGLLAALCVFAGLFPGLILDALAPVASQLTGAHVPAQAGQPWLTLTPVAATRSTYNGLLVAVFIALSGWLAAALVHRLASRDVRRGPAWDCGFPNIDPITQYGAGSFAQPIRRTLGTVLLRARESVDMPEPGHLRPARHEVSYEDPAWLTLYAPVARAVNAAATYANRFQFLTIRRYLSLVFASLILLLTGLTLWH